MITTEQLIADIRLACRLDVNDIDYTDAVILRIATSEHRLNIYPWLLDLNQNHGVKVVDVPLVLYKSDYKISNRTHGSALRDLNYVDAAANEYQLLHGTFDSLPRGRGTPKQFVLLGNTIRLGPTPDAPGYLRQYVNVKPSELVLSDDPRVRTIASIASATELTLSADPDSPGFRADFISQDSPHDLVGLSVPVSFAAGVLTVPSTDGLSEGDFVVTQGVSPVVQLPEELMPMLVESVAVRFFEAMNYSDQLATSNGRIDKLKEELSPLFSNRVKDAPQSLNSPL